MNSHRFLITGKVQGVWYRATVQRNAQDLGLDGYVRNLPDGSVEAGVTCGDAKLTLFIELIKEGSALSVVEDIIQTKSEELFVGGFVVR